MVEIKTSLGDIILELDAVFGADVCVMSRRNL